MIVIEQAEFIIATHTKGKVFSICMPLSCNFQVEIKDLVAALKLAGNVQTILQRF